MAPYERIARDLRKRLDQREWVAGQKLPSVRVLAGDYEVEVNTARKAVALLADWGYVRVWPKSGAVVLDRTTVRVPLLIGKNIGYDPTFGYIYNPAAGDWRPIGTPTRAWVELEPDVADLLGVADLDLPTLARRRVLGPGRPEQIATTYFAPRRPEDPKDPRTDPARFDTDDTGPGGWMQQVEQSSDVVPGGMGLGPLAWRCAVSSRVATDTEAQDLELARRSPVLVLAFPVTPRGWATPIALDVMVFDATRYRVDFAVPRAPAARWPVEPATGRNTALPIRT